MDNNDFYIYLEIEGLGEDENGNSSPVGMSIGPFGALKDEITYEQATQNIVVTDLAMICPPLNFIFANHKAKIISPKEYKEKYGDDGIV